MAGFGNFTNLTWDNNNPPAINDVNLQAAWDVIEDTDNELRRSKTVNGKDLLDYFYNVNCKEIENFTNESEFTAWASTTLSNDTTNNCMGKNAVKTLENDNVASYVGMYKDTYSLDLTKFNDGSASDTNDIIMCAFYVSDISKINYVTYKLGDDNSNNYNITFSAAALVTGWNIKRPKKSAFSTTGTPSGWDDITYCVFQYYSIVSSQNAYITWQYCALYREDVDYYSYYNPFQKYYGSVTGWVNIFLIMYDYFALYLDEAINKIGIIKIDPADNEENLYLGSQDYTNFISKWEFYCKKAGYLPSVVWWVDEDNYAETYVSANVLYLDVYEGGVLDSSSDALEVNINLNDRVELYFEKDTDSIKVILNTGKEYLKIITHETTISDSSVGEIYLGSTGTSSYGLLTDFLISHSAGYKLPENRIIFIKKQVTEIVNDSAALQNDDEFKLYLPANGIYEIELKLAVAGAANADFKCDWVVDGGCSQLTTRCCRGPSTATTDNTSTVMRSSRHNLTIDVSYGCDGAETAYISEKFLVKTTSAGTLQLRWAQNTAQASDTIVSANSYLIARKLA
jgi:hypothetical protein